MYRKPLVILFVAALAAAWLVASPAAAQRSRPPEPQTPESVDGPPAATSRCRTASRPPRSARPGIPRRIRGRLARRNAGTVRRTRPGANCPRNPAVPPAGSLVARRLRLQHVRPAWSSREWSPTVRRLSCRFGAARPHRDGGRVSGGLPASPLVRVGARSCNCADPSGRVLLLVQNWRNDELTNMDVRLAPSRLRTPDRPRGRLEGEAAPQ